MYPRRNRQSLEIIGPLARFALSLAYTLVAINMYQSLSVTWSALGFVWSDPTVFDIALCTLLCSLPALFLPKVVNKFIEFSTWILHYTLIIPAIFIPVIQNLDGKEFGWQIAALISLCSSILNMSTKIFSRNAAQKESVVVRVDLRKDSIVKIVSYLAIFITIYMFIVHRNDLQLTTFDRIYQQRESFGLTSGVFEAYLIPFALNILAPFLMITAIINKNYFNFLLSNLVIIIMYAATAQKSTILLPIFIIGTYIISRNGKFVYIIVLPIIFIIITASFIAAASQYSYLPILLQWFISVVFIRTLLLPGVIVGEYGSFSLHYENTYFSHSLLGRMFHNYPYGDYSIGQIVGLYMFPDQGMAPFELNGSFISTDGLAALSIPGIPVAFFLTGLALHVIEKFVGKTDVRLIIPASIPFLLTLTNVSVLTTMLTGGGWAFAVLYYLYSNSKD
jgi:hypothetical protein